MGDLINYGWTLWYGYGQLIIITDHKKENYSVVRSFENIGRGLAGGQASLYRNFLLGVSTTRSICAVVPLTYTPKTYMINESYHDVTDTSQSAGTLITY